MFIENVNYPFKSIIQEIPSTIDDSHATQLANKYERALISFFALKENSTREFSLIGSGFLILLPNASGVAIMTASHVITELMKVDFRGMIIDGEKYLLEKVNVLHNTEQDYALLELPAALFGSGKPLPYFNLTYRPELTPLSSFMITGYPRTKNQFHVDREPKGLHRLNLIFHTFGFDLESEDIYFHYNDKKGKKGTQFTPEKLSIDNNIPLLEGMSGGIISQIMINIENDSLSLRPVGIFKEYQRKRKLLAGNTFIQFADELKKTLNTL